MSPHMDVLRLRRQWHTRNHFTSQSQHQDSPRRLTWDFGSTVLAGMPRHALRRASERGSGDSPQAQLSLANVMKGVRLEVEAAAKRRCAVKGASLARKTEFLYLKNQIPDDVVCTGCVVSFPFS
ncbi:unnamed protein product [Prunus armeniaca]|uniref:Uncharacterized protein n=1 Tax=Prunus armeniaca TaxID=36596 RepID=A0A6J5XV98_PRUAR|nr:unnamed protein product [Prunus armeniaca]